MGSLKSMELQKTNLNEEISKQPDKSMPDLQKREKELNQYKEKSIIIFCLVWGTILISMLLFMTDIPKALPKIWKKPPKLDMFLYKDLYFQENWPGVDDNMTFSVDSNSIVHYFWCGEKIFRFEDYLGLLSVFRMLRPAKIMFYYHSLPLMDEQLYHSWFSELKQSAPFLVLRHTSTNPKCGSTASLAFALRQLAREGGVYVGERTVLTRRPEGAWSSGVLLYNFRRSDLSHDVTQGIIFSNDGFPEDTVDDIIQEISANDGRSCVATEDYDALPDTLRKEALCLVLTESLYPRNTWTSPGHFAELARWLYYGKRHRMEVTQVSTSHDLIPLVSHMVWLASNDSEDFQFLHYLSALSALHVAGFQRLFVHGDVEPSGPWWDKLKTENVTFVKIPRPESVFQRDVHLPIHQAAIVRINTLLKRGGAYQDRDVLWVSKLPEDIRRYPAVVSLDWARRGEWPDVINMGVVLSKPNSKWLREVLHSLKSDQWEFNSMMMPYRVYEQNPTEVYVDRHLQVVCFMGVCHPGWLPDYQRELEDFQPIINYDWRAARSFHFVSPKPPLCLTSPAAIKNGLGLYSDIGRLILEKSGKLDLLK